MKIYIFKQTLWTTGIDRTNDTFSRKGGGEEWRKKGRERKKTPGRSLMKIVYTVNGDLQPLENWFCVEARGG